MITGTIGSFMQLQKLTNKWEQKKNSKDILSKNERNERENWTKEQRIVNDFHEQLEREKESDRKHAIANKISSGQKLTPEEEQYLGSYDPKALSDYRQTQSERKAYEEKLKNCKTKDEVQKLKTTTLGGELSSLNKVVNDPYISTSEKLKKAQQSLGKTRNILAAEDEFVQAGLYDRLPTEAELLVAAVKEATLENEAESLQNGLNSEEVITEEILTEEQHADTSNPAKDIEKVYNHLIMCQQLEDSLLENSINMILKDDKEKKIGSKLNISA